MKTLDMTVFNVAVINHKLTAREIEDAIYNTFTEMERKDLLVTEIK